MNRRVVITGLGVIAPNGIGIEDFHSSLKEGKSGIRFIQELADYNFECKVAGVPELRNSKYFDYIEKHSLFEADICVKYSVLAAIEAWKSAGFEIPDYFSEKVNDDCGIIMGSSGSGLEYFSRKVYPLTQNKNIRKLGSQAIENIMESGPSAVIAMILALGNQTMENSSACSSGTESIILASDRIKSGKAEIMLAGGTDPFSPFSWAGFDSMRLLNRNSNELPEEASRPMSASAGGFVPAAGAGVIVIEELNHALNRNAVIFAEILGSSINCGGHRNGGSMYASNPQKAVKCIQKALSDSNIRAQDIDLICGHLTGTIADPKEIENWINALELKDSFPYINSTKSMTGHMIGATGAVEAIATVLQLKNKFVHPNINCDDLHPQIEKIYDRNKIPTQTVYDTELKYAIKASFGFGDVNSCLILANYK